MLIFDVACLSPRGVAGGARATPRGRHHNIDSTANATTNSFIIKVIILTRDETGVNYITILFLTKSE